MSKYLTGQEVIAALNIEDFELVELARKGMIQPFTRSGIPVRDIQEKRTLEKSEEHQLYILKLEMGSVEAGLVVGGSVTRDEQERNRVRLEAEIAKLEHKGIKPMSYEQIQEKLSQHLPCIWESFDLPVNEGKAVKLKKNFYNFIYLGSEVAKFKKPELVNDITISRDADITWDDITVTVLSDTELHFQWKTESVTRSYNFLGFRNKKTGNPINAWGILLKAAERRQIPYVFLTRSQVEKTAQTLRKNFKALFPMVEGDPVPINSATKVYEFSFKLKPQIE